MKDCPSRKPAAYGVNEIRVLRVSQCLPEALQWASSPLYKHLEIKNGMMYNILTIIAGQGVWLIFHQ